MKNTRVKNRIKSVLCILMALVLILSIYMPAAAPALAEGNGEEVASDGDAESGTDDAEINAPETTFTLKKAPMMSLGAGAERPVEALLNNSSANVSDMLIPEGQAAHKINLFAVSLRTGAEFYSSGYHDNDMLSEDPLMSSGLKDSGGTNFSGGSQKPGAYVWTADTQNSGHKFVYDIKLSLSGVGSTAGSHEVVQPGDVNIYIPAHILKLNGQSKVGEGGRYGDTLELSVPDINLIEKKTDASGNIEYVTGNNFAYSTKEINGQTYYVIQNIKPISAGEVYELPVAYKTTQKSYEYRDLGESDPFRAYVDFKTMKIEDPSSTGYIYTSSNQIPVHINTGAKLESVEKKVASTVMSLSELRSYVSNASTLDGLSLDEDHYYVVWSALSKVVNVTERYNFSINDPGPVVLTGEDADGNNHTITGNVIAVKLAGNSAYTAGKTDTIEGILNSGNRTDYIITAFPKEGNEGIDALWAAPRSGIYQATNSVSTAVQPADKDDSDNYVDKETVKSSNGLWKYELNDPNYVPPVENYTSKKYGLYGSGRSIVGGPGNVSSFNMDNLTEGKNLRNLLYLVNSEAYAFPKTVNDVNSEIRDMQIQDNGTSYSVTIGDTVYSHDENMAANEYTLKEGSAAASTVTDDHTVSLLRLKQIAALKLSEQYNKVDVTYTLEDNSVTLIDYRTPADPETQLKLESGDYYFDSVEYEYKAAAVEYDKDSMAYISKSITSFDETEEEDILNIYAKLSDGTEKLVATYNLDTSKGNIIDSDVVSSIDEKKVTFVPNTVLGYKIVTENKYYYVQLKATPSVTLLPSEAVSNFITALTDEDVMKAGVRNDAVWKVKNKNETKDSAKIEMQGTDYIAQAIKSSSINKKALDEDTIITGNDGKQYSSGNDTLNQQYTVAWKTEVSETVTGQGGNSNTEYVRQESGTFYDLLPAHCDIIPKSLTVTAYNYDSSGRVVEKVLPPASYTVYPRIDNYDESGKKLLKVEINSPCDVKYELKYVTVHTHDDLQDYGYIAVNTVAYQTGNENIGNGFPDDGGNKFFADRDHMIGLDPDNGDAKRFIYESANVNILALIQSASGVYKKVSSNENVSPGHNATVHQGEDYTYTIRMKNSQGTRARDIAILDSLENYMYVAGTEGAEGTRYNSAGESFIRDWKGTFKGVDLSGIEAKMKVQDSSFTPYLFLYVGDDIVNLEDDTNYSDASERKAFLNGILSQEPGTPYNGWVRVSDWRNPENDNVDLSKVTALIVYLRKEYTLGDSESISFTVKMTAPDKIPIPHTDPTTGYEIPPKTFNNIYRSFTNTNIKENGEDGESVYFYTHYDYTEVDFKTTGELSFSKADASTKAGVSGTVFRLSGTSDYGTVVDEELESDDHGRVYYSGLEKGTYTLTEEDAGNDHLLDSTPRRVSVTPSGNTMIVTIDDFDGHTATTDISGNAILYDQSTGKYEFVDDSIITHYVIENVPRIHTDLEFTKRDKYTGEAISGVRFTLNGTSAYNREYKDVEAESDVSGVVRFTDLEMSSSQPYILKETKTKEGYMPAESTYKVWIREGANGSALVEIVGEGDSADDVDNINSVIYNTPYAGIDIRKVDSITGSGLNNATFTLVTEGEATKNAIAAVIANDSSISSGTGGWVVDAESGYKKTLTKGNVGPDGEYYFGGLVAGTYRLTEEVVPDKYSKLSDYYILTITKKDDGTGYSYTLKDKDGTSKGVEFIKFENGRFVRVANEEDAESYRILNDEEFNETKLAIKSWVGTPMPEGFPSMHLSTEKPLAETKTVTIGNAFKTAISQSKTAIKKMEKASELPAGVTAEALETDSAYSAWREQNGEKGHFYAWVEVDTLKWWSDAEVVNLPIDSSNLFNGCTNLTKLDLRPFTSSKTTNMSSMFSGCTKLTFLDLRNLETANVTTMANMFNNCKLLEVIKIDPSKFTAGDKLTTVEGMFIDCQALQGIDLRGFRNCPNLTTIRSWFNRCYHLEYIDLSNFETSTNLNDVYAVFNHVCAGKDKGSGYRNGCAVFAKGKWEIGSGAAANKDNDNYFRINLYGTPCWNNNNKNIIAEYGGEGDPRHFTIQAEETLDQYTYMEGSLRPRAGYFNDANSDFYRNFTFPGETHDGGSGSGSSSSGGGDTSLRLPENFGTYHEYDAEEDSTLTADDIGNRSFTFEYVTGTEGTEVEVSGETGYEVDEDVYLTVDEIIDDNGTPKRKKTVYKYNPGTKKKAVWTKVDRNGTSQWELKVSVFDAEEEFFAWEDEVAGYNSTALWDNPTRVGSGETPVITNSQGPVGELDITKALTDENGTSLGKRADGAAFWVKVLMQNSDGSAYTYAPFAEVSGIDNYGVGYFKVIPGETTAISGLPDECKYIVSEVTDPADTDHPMPEGYEFDSITGGTTESTGTIVAGNPGSITPSLVNVSNKVITKTLTVRKLALLYKKYGDAEPVQIPDPLNDTDLAAWVATEFPYSFSFSNLNAGATYNYHIETLTGDIVDGSARTFTSDEEGKASLGSDGNLKIKAIEKIVFTDLPMGALYSVEETYTPDTTDTETKYEVSYEANSDEAVEAALYNGVLSDNDSIVYTNKKTVQKPDPNKLQLTITKNWVDKDGNPVTNQALLPETLTVYVGRKTFNIRAGVAQDTKVAVKTVQLNKYDFTENADGTWTAVVEDLPRYENNDTNLRYDYFISEDPVAGYTVIPTAGYTQETLKDYDDRVISFAVFTDTSDSKCNTLDAAITNKSADTKSFTITKTVDGKFGNKEKVFSFLVDLYDSTGKPLTGDGYRVQKTVDGVPLDPVTLLLDSGTMRIDLAHGETYSFLNLPAGTKVMVRENDYTMLGYTASAEYTVTNPVSGNEGPSGSGSDPADSTGNTPTEFANGDTISVNGNTVLNFTNTKDAIIPTGIYMGFISLLILGIALCLGIIFRTRRLRQLSRE